MLDQFLEKIEPYRDSYGSASFSYLASKVGDTWILYQGAIILKALPRVVSMPVFETENLRAALHPFSNLEVSLEDFLREAAQGRIRTPEGDVVFPKGDRLAIWEAYSPFHEVGLSAQARYNTISLYGDHKYKYIPQPQSDWEVRSADTPFDSIRELMDVYALSLAGDSICFEVTAVNVAAIDRNSLITGGKSRLVMRLAEGLDPKKASFGFKVIHRGQVVERGLVQGSSMNWEAGDGVMVGSFDKETEPASVLQCFANYSGITQNFYWLGDHDASQNPRRAIYEVQDQNLDYLQEVIQRAGGKGAASRDLEAAVSWLLWMLGFGAAHLGGTTRMQEAADVLAFTPQGHLALVECTTGHLKPDQKLPILNSRVIAVRRRLEETANNHIKVLGVLVTSMRREDIEADLEAAKRLSISVVCREDLQDLCNKTLTLPNTDEIYQSLEARLALPN